MAGASSGRPEDLPEAVGALALARLAPKGAPATMRGLLAAVAAHHEHEVARAVSQASRSLKEENMRLHRQADVLQAQLRRRHEAGCAGAVTAVASPTSATSAESDGGRPKGKRNTMSRVNTMTALAFARVRSSNYIHGEALQDVEKAPGLTIEPGTIFDRLVMRQGNLLRRAWDVVITLILVYFATLFPLRLVFFENRIATTGGKEDKDLFMESEIWGPIGHAIEAAFWADMAFHFLFTYTDEAGDEVTDAKKICRHYVGGRFLIDLVANLPPDVFAAQVNKILRIGRAHRLLHTLRLVRMARTTRFFRSRNRDVHKTMHMLRVARLMTLGCSLLVLVHWLACGWYLCATMHEDYLQTWVARRSTDMEGAMLVDQGPFVQWVHSIYFVCTVLTTVGFGDISALTVGEIAYVCIMMMLCTVINSIIISQIINVVSSVDESVADREHVSMVLEQFANYTQLDDGSLSSVRKWVQTSYSKRHAYDTGMVRSLLLYGAIPREIMANLPEAMFQGQLKRNRFISMCHFRGCKLTPPRLSLFIVVDALHRVHQQGELAYCRGDLPTGLFLVLGGTFANVARPHHRRRVTHVTAEPSDADEAASCDGKDDASGIVDEAEDGAYDSPSEENESDEAKIAGAAKDGAAAACLGGNTSDGGASPFRGVLDSGGRGVSVSEQCKKDNDGMQPYVLYGVRSYFGANELLLPLSTCTTTVRCESKNASVLVVQRANFTRLVQNEFPSFAQLWRLHARRNHSFYRRAHRRWLDERVAAEPLNYHDLAAAIIQRYVRHQLLEAQTKMHKTQQQQRVNL